MSDLKVEGPELKKMVKLGKKRSLSFGFCPGKGNDHTLMIDRRKKPAMLGKLARKESGAPKVAFGTFEVKGRTMEMTCERLVPQLAKTVKKYLKSQKTVLNVVVMDADGNTLESDIEDLPPDPDMDMEDAVEDAALAEADEAPADAQEPEPEPGQTEQNEDAPGMDAAALAARLKALQPAVAAAEEAVATKLKTVMSAAVGQIKSAALEQADSTITALEAAVAKLAAASAPAPEAATDQAAPDFKALAMRAQALKGAIADVAEPARDKLMTALTSAAKTIKERNHDAADALLTRIESAIEKVSSAAQTAEPEPEAQTDAAVETCNENWIQTRSTLQKDIADLKAEIDKATAGIDGLEDVAGKSDVLFDYIKGIDESLENTLKDLSKTVEDASREALKTKARQIVETYKDVLDTEFFKAVDNNGFKKTNIRGSALTSLQQVSAALAA